MNRNGRFAAEMPNVAGDVCDLTHDVIELSELQTRLLLLDIKKSTQRTRTCLILAVVAACLLLGSIPVALYALARVFVEFLEWPESASFGLAALIGLVIAAIIGGAAYAIVKSGLFSLDRSREEFSRNIAWIKMTLKDRGQMRAVAKP
jgi:hypothetical protein